MHSISGDTRDMRAVTRYYNIHDVATIKIVDQNNWLKKLSEDFTKQYAYFETEEIEDPLITIRLGDFVASNQNCGILDDEYYIRDDYLYCARDSYKTARWMFEATGFESKKLNLSIASNLSGTKFTTGYVIDAFVNFMLNCSGYPVVHASCVSKDDQAFLFSARGGGGKTTIALRLVERGFEFLGDNFVLIRDGDALSYVSPLSIFTYNIAPIVKQSFTAKRKLSLAFKDLLYRLTGGYVKFFSKFDVRDLFPGKIAEKSHVRAVFLLEPKDVYSVQPVSKEHTVNHLIANMRLESVFFRYVSSYSYLFPDSRLGCFWASYRANLRENLSDDVRYFTVSVPQEYDDRTLENMERIVRNETNAAL